MAGRFKVWKEEMANLVKPPLRRWAADTYQEHALHPKMHFQEQVLVFAHDEATRGAYWSVTARERIRTDSLVGRQPH